MKYMICRFKLWLIKMVVGNEPVVMNVIINGKGIKRGWNVVSYGGNPHKCVISPAMIKKVTFL